MARVDHYNDPNAPRPNRLVPSVSAVVRDEDGRLLLVLRTDNELWSLPGGAMDLGETIADAGVREIAEETGVRIEITDLVGLYTSPGHVIAYDDGEVRQEFSVCFHARRLEGDPRADGAETRDAAFVAVEDLDGLPMHPSMRTRINDALGDRARPRIA